MLGDDVDFTPSFLVFAETFGATVLTPTLPTLRLTTTHNRETFQTSLKMWKNLFKEVSCPSS